MGNESGPSSCKMVKNLVQSSDACSDFENIQNINFSVSCCMIYIGEYIECLSLHIPYDKNTKKYSL